MSAHLVDLAIELSARDPALGASVRQAATLIAGHPGFPNDCPRQPCSTAADREQALVALDLAADALVDLPDTRAARRCVAEAARVIVAARRFGTEDCSAAAHAQASELVDAWPIDPAARARAICLCGACEATQECTETPVLGADADPIEFLAQVRALGGNAAAQCVQSGACDALVEAAAAALEAEECTARTLLSLTRLGIGRRCAGAGRFRHPGLLALDAALGRWSIWPLVGTAASRHDLLAAVMACRPE